MPEGTKNAANFVPNEGQTVVCDVEGGQWKLKLWNAGTGKDTVHYKIFNPNPENPGSDEERFFTLDDSGPFGQGMINPENTLKIPLKGLGLELELTGCILIESDGSSADRFSLTKKTYFQKVAVSLDMETRELLLDGKPTGFYLVLLVLKDKNRIRGSDGYFTRTKTEEIKIVELETLANSILREMRLIS
jgi:hypothetical protein